MQTALVFSPAAPLASLPPVSRCPSFCNLAAHQIPLLHVRSASWRPRRALVCWAQQSEPDQYVVYDEKKSVFPAEACEELGGDSCEIDGVGPEVKPRASSPKEPAQSPLGGKDREYVEYTSEKTVFPGEACEELGGEFCEPDYQTGVFPEKVAAK